jgi:hypothetical protein
MRVLQAVDNRVDYPQPKEVGLSELQYSVFTERPAEWIAGRIKEISGDVDALGYRVKAYADKTSDSVTLLLDNTP